jgi:hypothetical protein
MPSTRGWHASLYGVKEVKMKTPWMSTSRASHWICGVVLVLTLLSTTGCSAIAVALGLRIRLDKLPVTAISASLVDKHGATVNALGPGQSAKLVIVATTADGKQFPTVGAGKGKVAFDNYTIDATLVPVNKGGKVSLSTDPRVSEGKSAHLRIAPVAHPEVVTEMAIPVRYDIAYVANLSGSDGASGLDGIDGLDGSAGTDASPPPVDPTTGAIGTQGPGGNGSDGGNGTDGSDGHDGAPGAAVHIWVRLESGTHPLLQVKVAGGGRESLFIVDPNGGTLRVLDDGGAGGRGGTGGRAGRGGSGGQGFPSGFSGLDGQPGSDGRNGSAGRGGTITLSVDPAAQSFLSCITWSNHGGEGGSGSAPTINVEPVPALW